MLDLYCLGFASEMALWYFSLTSIIFRKFAGDCLKLYLLTDPFISFLAALILLIYQPLALLFDLSIRPKKFVSEATVNPVSLLPC